MGEGVISSEGIEILKVILVTNRNNFSAQRANQILSENQGLLDGIFNTLIAAYTYYLTETAFIGQGKLTN